MGAGHCLSRESNPVPLDSESEDQPIGPFWYHKRASLRDLFASKIGATDPIPTGAFSATEIDTFLGSPVVDIILKYQKWSPIAFDRL